MEPRIDPINTNRPVPRTGARRSPAERGAFERELEQKSDEDAENEQDKPTTNLPDLGEREPGEAGGMLDLLG